MSKQIFPGQLALIATAIALALPSIARAQASPEAGDDKKPEVQKLETVVIQARGRTETLQSVPVSVKAFSAQAITDAGIKKPGDFVALSPNLSLAESQSVGTSFMTIRGLSQVRNGEAPMAVVVDGVAQSDAKQFTQELFDVQSIEVLRGPQGALYGRNASGGAILIRTKQPTNETTGFVQLSAGTGGEKIAQGAISGAIVPDKLMFRLAGNTTDRAGYFEDLATHSKADAYKNKTLRGLLTWNASEDLSIDLRTSFVRDNAGGGAFQYQPTHLNADCTADLNNLFDFSRLDANRVSRTFCNNNLGINTRDMDEITLKADYALGFATLTGIVSHNKVNEYLSVDQFPYTASRSIAPGLDGTQTQFVDVSSDSYELRLTSPSKKGLRWMAGVYALNTERFVSTTTGTDLGHGVDFISYDPKPNSSTNPTASWFADRNHNRASAAFGNIDYDISPKLELSLAARYDRDQREQVVDHRQAAGSLPAGCSASNVAACTKQATYSAMQPKLSLRYKSDEGALSYFSIGKGFRSGQFNQSGVGAAAAAATPPVMGVQDQIGAEITTSAEIGYKALLAEGKVQLNAAAFRTQVENAPYFVFIGAVGAQVLVPLDKLTLTGGELELVAKLAPGLDAYAGLGVTHSRIDKYVVNPALVGKQAPYVPSMGWNLGAQYRFGLLPGINLSLRADVVNKGKQYWDPENSTARDAVTLLNLRFALEDAKNKWSTALSVNNASDKAYNAEWVAGGFATPALPRIVRLDLRYNF
ncbi:TonB-dependent receptor [Paucibacter sp. KBW04]|uniref:TonB-dependent receptor n=1 Tax=Paucibacter sp. KBW04 TaxID=2153361 RepID=UPI000F57C3DF|nr:TonB-dependent receptor [Paucibacter sp. KBW04]RQO59341.1 TonB-dependent receptor [Paucibacter sp. KBW04]